MGENDKREKGVAQTKMKKDRRKSKKERKEEMQVMCDRGKKRRKKDTYNTCEVWYQKVKNDAKEKDKTAIEERKKEMLYQKVKNDEKKLQDGDRIRIFERYKEKKREKSGDLCDVR